MRKFYSLVLMAAALLIGTNVKAATVEVTSGEALKTAFSNPHDGDVIKVTAASDFVSVEGQVHLNANVSIKLDLNGHDLEINNISGTKNAAILVEQGRLEIVSTSGEGSISNKDGNTKTSDLIRLNGTTAENDAAVDVPYSQVTVGANVTLNNSNMSVLTICEKSGQVLANGARIDVLAGATLEAVKYGIKVNGNIKDPAELSLDRKVSPYVYIHAGASVISAQNTPSAVAAYSSGYARWRIEGTCSGSTGLYAKSGDVAITGNARIESSSSHVVPTGKTSGVNAGGSAIVIESNAAYPGGTSVVISGGTIAGSGGYAIEEKITTAANTEVEAIQIVGGFIDGGTAGAVIVDDQTIGQVSVVGGTVEGNITQGHEQGEGESEATSVTAKQLSDLVPGGASDGVFEIVTDTEKGGYKVISDASKVATLNASGLGTFSFVDSEYDRTIPEGLKAYKAEYVDMESSLILDKITTGVIPAQTGVLLYGTPNRTYVLATTAKGAGLSGTNHLVAANLWTGHQDNVYVLSGNSMHKYEGDDMKPNKAYLQLPGGAGAPARVRLVFAEEEEATAIENVEAEAVKAEKFFENGMIFIQRGENIYNIQGQIVK